MEEFLVSCLEFKGLQVAVFYYLSHNFNDILKNQLLLPHENIWQSCHCKESPVVTMTICAIFTAKLEFWRVKIPTLFGILSPCQLLISVNVFNEGINECVV